MMQLRGRTSGGGEVTANGRAGDTDGRHEAAHRMMRRFNLQQRSLYQSVELLQEHDLLSEQCAADTKLREIDTRR
jgi:hypothetical protein